MGSCFYLNACFFEWSRGIPTMQVAIAWWDEDCFSSCCLSPSKPITTIRFTKPTFPVWILTLGGFDVARLWKLAILTALLGSLAVPWLHQCSFEIDPTELLRKSPGFPYEAVCFPAQTLGPKLCSALERWTRDHRDHGLAIPTTQWLHTNPQEANAVESERGWSSNSGTPEVLFVAAATSLISMM